MNFKVSLVSLALLSSLSLSTYAEDLLDIYKEALQRDTQVSQAKAEAQAAHAGLSEATAALLPQIDVVGNLTKTRTNVIDAYNARGSNKQATGAINLSQTLWRHSSWANRSIAEKTATLKDLAYADAQQNLIVRVSNAYFNVLNAADTLKFQKANNAALKRQLSEANRRFNVGLIAQTDKLEAQAAYDLSNAAVIAAENELINSKSEIRMLIGREIDVNKLAKIDESKFAASSVSNDLIKITKKAEENNLALQQAVISRDIAKDNITLARSGHEPTLDFNARAQTGYTEYDTQVAQAGFVDNNSWAHSVGLTLNIPIFHGGATSAAVDKAQANYIYAQEGLEKAHRTLLTNVSNSYNNVNAAISSVTAYNNYKVSADSALSATKAGYEVGTRTMTDVLNATQNLYDAMQKSAQARYTYILSRLSLLYAQGDLKVEHIDQINQGLKK
ncbi:MAG: TolC family outer membrane protein [Succinivibrio sp.]|nr:TolC family outer membrane protein [Succinivibrio sp.]MCI5637930.1 TolC family outer membrane protein [Succinivibrio sp.]MDD6067802.1 TolC family outer membrane protein [Succinivibrio sp.]MDY4992171.1 TolC family outer membrane protein [Succinivibrio sp.]